MNPRLYALKNLGARASRYKKPPEDQVGTGPFKVAAPGQGMQGIQPGQGPGGPPEQSAPRDMPLASTEGHQLDPRSQSILDGALRDIDMASGNFDPSQAADDYVGDDLEPLGGKIEGIEELLRRGYGGR